MLCMLRLFTSLKEGKYTQEDTNTPTFQVKAQVTQFCLFFVLIHSFIEHSEYSW